VIIFTSEKISVFCLELFGWHWVWRIWNRSWLYPSHHGMEFFLFATFCSIRLQEKSSKNQRGQKNLGLESYIHHVGNHTSSRTSTSSQQERLSELFGLSQRGFGWICSALGGCVGTMELRVEHGFLFCFYDMKRLDLSEKKK